MGWLADMIRDEPVIVSRIVPLALAGLAAFGVVVTEDQRLWFVAVAALIADAINTAKARSKVTPMAKIEEISPSTARQLE